MNVPPQDHNIDLTAVASRIRSLGQLIHAFAANYDQMTPVERWKASQEILVATGASKETCDLLISETSKPEYDRT